MLSMRPWQVVILSAALLASPAWGSPARRHHYRHHHYYRHHHRSHYIRGQRSMDSERIDQIQTALIRDHYLTGQPDGEWNDQTQAAMRKYQADHGWQTKLLPDARALIKLGLGPKVDESEEAKNKQPGQPQPSISYADTLAAVHALRE